jgi:hypothetical protein
LWVAGAWGSVNSASRLNMRAISRLLGISESRVSQLHARAIRLLRERHDRALSLDPEPERRPSRRPIRAGRHPLDIAARA